MALPAYFPPGGERLPTEFCYKAPARRLKRNCVRVCFRRAGVGLRGTPLGSVCQLSPSPLAPQVHPLVFPLGGGRVRGVKAPLRALGFLPPRGAGGRWPGVLIAVLHLRFP